MEEKKITATAVVLPWPRKQYNFTAILADDLADYAPKILAMDAISYSPEQRHYI